MSKKNVISPANLPTYRIPYQPGADNDVQHSQFRSYSGVAWGFVDGTGVPVHPSFGTNEPRTVRRCVHALWS